MTDLAYATDDDTEALEPINDDVEGGVAESPEWLSIAVQSPNLAYELDASVLTDIAGKVCDEYDLDCDSLEEAGWFKNDEDAVKLAMLVKEAKSYPWEGASNIKYPLLTTACIQFAARAYGAIVPGFNVVKGKVLGKPTPEKTDRADRISAHMSYQLLEEMEGWEEDTDKLLHMLPARGCVFRKTYFDPTRGTNVSTLVPPDKFIVNYWTRDLESCPRMTHLCEYYPNEIEIKFRSGLWMRVDLGQPETDADDPYAAREFLEQHRLLDLDDDGLPEPYIVTVHHESRQVVRIVARFDEEGIEVGPQGEVVQFKADRYFTKYTFIPSLDGSFYDIGFGALLSALNDGINTTMNQLFDAGHLANVQGGFIGSGVSMKSGAMRFKPGEWKRVESTGGSLRDNLMPLNMPGPSPVLFQLLQFLIQAAQDVTSTKDVLTGDTTPTNQPVGTTMALIEQGLKVYSAIFKRIHRAFKWELAVLRRLNRKYLDPESYFVFQDKEGVIAQQDYAEDDVDVIPVSDPTVVMDSQRLARAQYLGQYMQLPFMNQQEIVKRSLEAADIPEIDALFVKQGPSPEAVTKGEELRIQSLKADTERMKAEATVKKDTATTIKTLFDAAAIQTEHNLAPIDPGELQRVEATPVDGGVPAVPEGVPDPAGGPMGGGQPQPGGMPPGPEAGPDPMGAGDAGMGSGGPAL